MVKSNNVKHWQKCRAMRTHIFLVEVYIGATTLQNSLSLLNKNEDIDTQLANKIKYIYIQEELMYCMLGCISKNKHLEDLFINSRVDK